jgi:hypothetical protein
MKPPLAPELKGKLVSSELQPTHGIVGEDEQDTLLLQRATDEATRYITSFLWCERVLDSYFAGGVAGIFAIFFFHIRPGRPGVDPWIWIVVGDIPNAYLSISDCESAQEVFATYMGGMRRWVELARENKSGTAEQGVPPVNVPPTPEWAETLNKKLEGLDSLIRPLFENDGQVSFS